MKVVVNGERKDLPDGTTVAELVGGYVEGDAGRGYAVALNGEVVRRAEWSEMHLNDDDKVEVLRAIGGGAY